MKRFLNTILLIDDREEDNFLHKRSIAKAGFKGNVLAIESPEDAIKILTPQNSNSIQPDLIFLDVNMPRINGWELLEEYASMAPELKYLPIIYILSTNEYLDIPLEENSFLVSESSIVKPLTPEKFIEIAETHFEKITP